MQQRLRSCSMKRLMLLLATASLLLGGCGSIHVESYGYGSDYHPGGEGSA